ncbi:MAG: hypothetical protein HY060_24420 [Proteobacteria bacterium]|nr:hypothetical protein [Pseudomonadota bacterium]
MADDDEPGGSPACFLDEVDPAYAGFLTEAELGHFLEALRGREQALVEAWRRRGARGPIPDALVASIVADLNAAIAMVDADLARSGGPAGSSGGRRFADSSPTLVDFMTLEADIAAALKATLPRIRSDALHAVLRKVLCMHHAHRAALEGLVAG